MRYRNGATPWAVLIFLCWFGFACAPVPTATSTHTSLPPTGTATPTLLPSATSTYTLPPTLTPTITQTPQPTWTPLPTLASAQARQYVEELLTTNAGCKLPCWWGIVPGETSWPQAMHIVDLFSIEILEGDIYKQTIDDNITDTQNISLHYNVPGEKLPGHTLLGLRDDIVFFVDVNPSGTDRNYRLHQIFNEYGKPAAIFTEIAPNSGWTSAFLILHYPQQGIIVEYEVDAQELDSHYQACFHSASPSLILWSPELNLTIFNIWPYSNIPVTRDISPLEESTSISVDDFFESYQSAADTQCLELSH